MMLATLAFVAIVAQDQSALRAAPRDSARQQAVLWQGDSLEIRGEKMDYLQVYDHRRERAGYIRASQVRIQPLRAADAPDLLALVRFLRDTPGSEALGISYAAAYLKAAPGEAIGVEAYDALGTMAERLARRASARGGKASDAATAAHLETAAGYGVALRSFERDGRIQYCYEGAAFRRVLSIPATEEQRARAVLALTRHDCIDPNQTPIERNAHNTWRAEVLDQVDPAALPEYLKNRVRLRRAGVWAALSYQLARRADVPQATAQQAARRALTELTEIHKAELAEDDAAAYTDAALRVSAARWAAEDEPKPRAGLSVAASPGQPGETCVNLIDAKHDLKAPLARRCTYGLAWTASARANAHGTALSLAVQTLDTWRELWVFHRDGKGVWSVDVLPPAASGPDLGYIEFAGWAGANKILAAREARVDGRFQRSFEVIRLDTLAVEKRADQPGSISLFYRWQDPAWKRQTLSMR